MVYDLSLINKTKSKQILSRRVNTFNAEGTFLPKHTYIKIFENHLNPVILVFIG